MNDLERRDNNMTEDSTFSVNQLIRDTGKQSLKSAKWFVLIIILFVFSNILFLIISLTKYYGVDKTTMNTVYLVLSILIGVGITFVAFSNTYKYLLIDTLHIVYKYLKPFFRKLSIKIIEKVSSKAENFSSNKNIQKSFNIGNILLEVYGKKVPGIIQKAILFLIKQIPFSDFIFNMKDELAQKNDGDDKRLSEILYQQIDQYIRQTVFLGNNMKWIMWLLPTNIVLQIILIFMIK